MLSLGFCNMYSPSLDCILTVRSVFQGWKIWSDKLRSVLRLQAFACFSDCIPFLVTYSDWKYILRIKSLFPYRKFLKTIPACIWFAHYKPLYLLSCTKFFLPSPSSSHENARSSFTRYREPILMKLWRKHYQRSQKAFCEEWQCCSKARRTARGEPVMPCPPTWLTQLLELRSSTYRSWNSPRAE